MVLVNQFISLRCLLVVCAVMGFITGCDFTKTEQEQYADLQDGFIYKSYQKISRKTVPLAVTTYKREHEKISDDTPVNLTNFDTHFGLALLLVTTFKYDLALAESNISSEYAVSDVEKALAQSLISFIMYQKKWPTLAREQSAQANALLKGAELDGEISVEQLHDMFAVVFLLLAFQESDEQLMQEVLPRISWVQSNAEVGSLCEALMLIRLGDYTKGFNQLEQLANDADVSPELKADIQNITHALKEAAGLPEDEKLGEIMTMKVVLKILMSQLKAKASTKSVEWMQWLEELRDKIPV